MIRLLLWSLLLVPLTLSAAIYKWVDDDGKTHYSQTPPPKHATPSQVMGDHASAGEADPAYCAAVQRFAARVAVNMRRGVDVKSMVSHVNGVEDEVREKLGTNEPVLRQIVYAVYGYRPSSLSPASIGRLIQQNCMNGSFAARDNSGRITGGARGTGWPVTATVVVTNYHVVRNAKRYTLALVSGTRLDAELLAFDAESDIALLRLKGDKHRFTPIPLSATPPSVGTDVFTVGYPHPDVMGTKPKLTRGIINALSGYRDDPRTFQISVPLQSGNSGGPLVTLGGRVVGVVTAKLSAATMLKKTGDVTQNVNYAIKASYVKALLARNGVEDFSEQPGAGEQSLSDAARDVSPRVVMVIAR